MSGAPLQRALVLLCLPLSACAGADSSAVHAPLPSVATETITVAVGPCFGFCPVYTVSISSSGSVGFLGERHTAVLGRRTQASSIDAYRELARQLAGYRPADGGHVAVECQATVSDTSTFTVTWSGADGNDAVATIASGCPGGPGHALIQILKDLPVRLGIADWAKQTMRPGTPRG